MSSPHNPYAPNQPQHHRAFELGREQGLAERADRNEANVRHSDRPMQSEAAMCSRASAKTMIEIRIGQLQAEIDGLRSIAKFAEAMEGTPADEYLWKLIVNQRS